MGFRPPSARSMIASCVSGVHTAMQGSGSLARTVPVANAVRNRAGMLSRFFASNECSKWPRNANGHDQGVRTGVAEWEEPRHSGQLLLPPYPTISHSATRFPTFPSDGSRRRQAFARFLALWSAFYGVGRGGAAPLWRCRFGASEPEWAQACMRIRRLVGFLQTGLEYRNRGEVGLLGDA